MVFPYAVLLTGKKGGRHRPTLFAAGAGLRGDPSPARWRHLAHSHGSNSLGGVMVTVMLYAVVLTLLAS
jgi:hypothetical protein